MCLQTPSAKQAVFQIKIQIDVNPTIKFQIHNTANSKDQIRSWEANRFSAGQDIPRILCHLQVHFCVQKTTPAF
jgi:hypothetical protein